MRHRSEAPDWNARRVPLWQRPSCLVGGHVLACRGPRTRLPMWSAPTAGCRRADRPVGPVAVAGGSLLQVCTRVTRGGWVTSDDHGRCDCLRLTVHG
ncbi:protein of unknown function [Modestobacter italicus]|uniref:Uncharacterized protein n=1 Tax=Modestobacter italicus (strain DSM 44449 / CECT 9708 / BC 501) TaxID=2732864 RepID=I4ERB7_MODI5|nr:protein of unknown function [Modestobacter marinus]